MSLCDLEGGGAESTPPYSSNIKIARTFRVIVWDNCILTIFWTPCRVRKVL